jgi:hypothetical protein
MFMLWRIEAVPPHNNPRLETPDAAILKPEEIRAKERKLQVDPRRKLSRIEQNPATLAKDLTEKAEPSAVDSITLILHVEPTLKIPWTERADPSLVKLRSERVEPTVNESRTETMPPTRKAHLTDTLLPIRPQPMTEI